MFGQGLAVPVDTWDVLADPGVALLLHVPLLVAVAALDMSF